MTTALLILGALLAITVIARSAYRMGRLDGAQDLYVALINAKERKTAKWN